MSEPVVLTPTGRKVVAIYGSQLVDDVVGIETEAVRMGQEAGEALGAYRGVDAFLASPQAAEELARATEGLWRRLWVESAALGWHYQTWMDESVAEPFDNGDLAASLLTAWQKLRHPEDGSGS